MTWRFTLVPALLLLAGGTALLAQSPESAVLPTPQDTLGDGTPATASPLPDSASWFIDDIVVATLHSTQSGSAAARVASAHRSLELLRSSGDPMFPVQTFEIAGQWTVLSGSHPLLVVTPEDAEATGLAPDTLAALWAENLQHALLEPERQQARQVVRRTLAWGLVYPILYVIGLVLTYRLLALARRRLHREARRLEKGGLPGFAPEFKRRALVFAARSTWAFQALVFLALTYALAVGLLSLFPETRRASAWLGEGFEIAGKLLRRVLAFTIPRLLALALLLVLLRGAFRLVDNTMIMARRGRGRFSLRRDQARLVGFFAKVALVLLATLFAATLLPPTEGRVITLVVVFVFLVGLVLVTPVLLNLGHRLYFGFVRPFELHDDLTSGPVQGTVVGVDLFGVRVATRRGDSVFVPYRVLAQDVGVRPRDWFRLEYRVRLFGQPEQAPRLLHENLAQAVAAAAAKHHLKSSIRITRSAPKRLDAMVAVKLRHRDLEARMPETKPVAVDRQQGEPEPEDPLRQATARREALRALHGEFLLDLSEALRSRGHDFVISDGGRGQSR